MENGAFGLTKMMLVARKARYVIRRAKTLVYNTYQHCINYCNVVRYVSNIQVITVNRCSQLTWLDPIQTLLA